MSYKFFKQWTLLIIGLVLFFIYQMFFGNLTRFTVACSYFINATLMFFIWLNGWENFKQTRVLEKEIRANLVILNELMQTRIKFHTHCEKEDKNNGQDAS
jgi:hypothetical protein